LLNLLIKEDNIFDNFISGELPEKVLKKLFCHSEPEELIQLGHVCTRPVLLYHAGNPLWFPVVRGHPCSAIFVFGDRFSKEGDK